MSDIRLLSRDPDHGVTQYFHTENDGSFVIETVTDCTDLIEANKAVATADFGRWKDLNLVARYPNSVWLDLKKRGILDDPAAYRKWLNDADNQVWRIRPGKV